MVIHEWAASFLINSVFPFQDVHPVNHEDRDGLLPFGQRRQVSTLCLLSRSRQVVGKDCHRLNKGSGSTTRKWHLWGWTMGSKGAWAWALTFFGKTKTSVFSANKQSRFESVILEGVLVGFAYLVPSQYVIACDLLEDV